MNPRHALVLATGLAGLGAAITFLVGLGAGLSEDPGAWFFWVLTVVFGVLTALCDFARRRG